MSEDMTVPDAPAADAGGMSFGFPEPGAAPAATHGGDGAAPVAGPVSLNADSYQDFALPNGVTADPDLMGAFRDVAAQHGLSQDAAQAMMDLYGRTVDAGQQHHSEVTAQWASDVRADAELGGAKLDAVAGTANAALKAYGSPELVQLLNQTGLGNHPEVVRAFYRAGKALSEDGRPAGTAPIGRDPLAAMYPTMFSHD